jgi:hypothetical protein
MAVRNFYIKARADGRASSVGVGPARKDGGLRAMLSIRDQGSILEAFEVEAYAPNSGQLILSVRPTRALRDAIEDGTAELAIIADGDGRMVVRTTR